MDTNSFGQTALHMALKMAKETLACYITKRYPALINTVGKDGESTLHYAAEGGNLTLIKHLIQNGMDTKCLDNYDCTILQTASIAGQKDAVVYLFQFNDYLIHAKDISDKTALHYAAEEGNINIFKYLVNAGIDVHARSNDKENMLHIACIHKNHEIIDYLLQNYADNMIQGDKDGWYPYHVSAWQGDVVALRIFMNKKNHRISSNSHPSATAKKQYSASK